MKDLKATHNGEVEHLHPEPPIACCTNGCSAQVSCDLALPKQAKASDGEQVVYSIQNMDCPMEEALIRKKLASMPGILGLDFNLIQRVLTVHHNLKSTQVIEQALSSIGMAAVPITKESKANAETEQPLAWKRLALAGLTALAAELVALAYGGHSWPVLALALAAILLGGLETYKKGWIAIKNLNLNMNALMSCAVTGAILIGEWPEAAMVMVLFSLSELIEAKSLTRARKAIRNLLDLSPKTATIQIEDGKWSEMELSHIQVGQIVRIRPGERIGLDGKILTGHSTLDQAPITGESLPVEKSPGDQVFAGSINTSGSFEYQVTAEAGSSTLSRIIYAVEAAQANRAPIQRFVDSFARVYTPLVFLVALLTALLPPLVMDGQWLDWIYKALVLLVIACPCALVISTPISIVSALSAASRRGILIKGGVFLEQGRKLNWIALDKTGTLTHGKPEQTDCLVLGQLDQATVNSLAVSLTSRSDHPVSQAISRAAQVKHTPLQEVQDFSALPGRGIQGRIGKDIWYLGNHRLLHDLGHCTIVIEKKITQLEEEGKSVVALVSEKKGCQGLFAVADTLRPSSLAAIAALHQQGVRTMILTGDNEHTARAIAAQAKVDAVRANLLPEDKLEIVAELTKSGKVGMVGDGINDAPALARADIGFAMGAIGTDAAIETADVALMDDDLGKLPLFIRLSRRTHAILVQNISMALAVKALFFVLTFCNLTTMWMAVFADVGVTLLVIGNGLRLLRYDQWQALTEPQKA